MSQAKRTYVELSDEKRAQIRRAQEQVKEELPELARRLRMANEAAEENTFSGELRRAIHASGLTISRIADRAGISPLVLDEFLTGDRTLRSDVIDRLINLLGCKMAQATTEIVTSKRKFPLEEAYAFSRQHGGELCRQIENAREKLIAIKKNKPNQAWSVLRGIVIGLFEKHGVLDQFVREVWRRSSSDHERELNRCRRLLARYEEEFGRLT
jgi:transcriptional regulator with XRE-family HTH domain